MKISEHANYLLNEYGRLQFDYAAYCKPYGESLRNEARNNLETYIAELEAEVTKGHELQDAYCDRIAELEGKLDQLTARWRQERQDDKWIPVSERLPEVDQEVLVFDQRGDITIDYLVALNREGVAYYTNSDDGAVCWMPLPQPPEVTG